METTTKFPSLLQRLQSTFVDFIVILFFIIVFSQVSDLFENFPTELRIAFLIGVSLYEPICTALGFTVGHYLLGIRVRKENNTDEKINILYAIVRYIFKVALGWVSFITIHSNEKRRAIHDMVSGSVMIKL